MPTQCSNTSTLYLEKLWVKVKAQLQQRFSEAVVEHWFGSAEMEDFDEDENIVKISVATVFLQRKISEEIYLRALKECFTEELGYTVRVIIIESRSETRKYIHNVQNPTEEIHLCISAKEQAAGILAKEPDLIDTETKSEKELILLNDTNPDLSTYCLKMPIRPVRVVSSTILEIIAEAFDVRLDYLISKARMRPIPTIRHIAAYIAKEATTHSLNEVGRACGGRDHTTILNSIKKSGNGAKKVRCSIQTYKIGLMR